SSDTKRPSSTRAAGSARRASGPRTRRVGAGELVAPVVGQGGPTSARMVCAVTCADDLLEHLDLHEAGRSRPPAWQPRGDAHALAALAPAELHHAPGGVGDQLLGRLVAAGRGRLHTP